MCANDWKPFGHLFKQLRPFVTMELHAINPNLLDDFFNFRCLTIDENRDLFDRSGKAARNSARVMWREVTLAATIKIEAKRVGPRIDRRACVVVAGDTTNLDSKHAFIIRRPEIARLAFAPS